MTAVSVLTILCIFLSIFYGFYRRIWSPLQEIAQQVQNLPSPTEESASRLAHGTLDVRHLARNVAQMAALAAQHERRHREVDIALNQARRLINELEHQQNILLSSANRQIIEQYQSIIAYAHYLEEQVARRHFDPALRYDFDDVCESGFRLKLIANAFTRLTNAKPAKPTSFALAGLMQQTMLALASSLDRRAMRLTTAEVDEHVTVRSDPEIISHAVWLMLLGIIGYAAEESTLRMRCLRSHTGERTLMSIVVSELSPGNLSVAEREAHLARQLQHLTPHMFAETIRIHAGVQLAQLLLAPLDAAISVVPLTHYACELCLDLPAGD